MREKRASQEFAMHAPEQRALFVRQSDKLIVCCFGSVGIIRVISSSPADIHPVLETIGERPTDKSH